MGERGKEREREGGREGEGGRKGARGRGDGEGQREAINLPSWNRKSVISSSLKGDCLTKKSRSYSHSSMTSTMCCFMSCGEEPTLLYL